MYYYKLIKVDDWVPYIITSNCCIEYFESHDFYYMKIDINPPSLSVSLSEKEYNQAKKCLVLS